MNWIRVLNIHKVFRRSYFLFHNASFKLGWPDFKPKLIRSVSIRNMTSSKNYLIVGGSSGIGASIVTNLMCEHTVYSTYFKHTPVEKAENLHSAFYNVLDGEFPDFLPEVLHGIVYCPGAIDLKPFHRVSSDQLIADFQLQVVGAFKTIQAILSRLKKADAASIVLFSTVAVQTGFPFHSMVASSKGAIEGLTRSLAAELAPKIRVNAVAPSLTATPLAANLINTEEKIHANAARHPLRRIGQPSDIAHAVSYLLSDQSAWVTGQVLAVDGGISRLRV